MNKYRQLLLKSIDEHSPEEELTERFWFNVSLYSNLTEEFIREFAKELYWINLSRVNMFSDVLLLEFKDYVVWDFYFRRNAVNFNIMKNFILKTKLRTTEQFKTSLLSNLEKEEIQRLLDFKYKFII